MSIKNNSAFPTIKNDRSSSITENYRDEDEIVKVVFIVSLIT